MNNMKDHEFYKEYASLPLSKRIEYLGYYYGDLGGQHLTPHMIYKEIKDIDDKTRKDLIRKDVLLRIADKYFNSNN